MYIAYCYNTLQIKHSTIKLYLSGIRFEYLRAGTPCPLLKSNDPCFLRIHALMKAVKRVQGKNKRLRHPITRDVLNQMCFRLHHDYSSPYINSLLEAASVTSFCGFLRCSEITAPRNNFDPQINLCLSDVVFSESKVELNLKSSKTDLFRKGVCISLLKTGSMSNLCPLSALSKYLVLRNRQFPNQITAVSPFFLTDAGEPTQSAFYVNLYRAVIGPSG